MISTALALLLVMQQGANTTPASGDTTGYWQQHVSYRMVGTLDEATNVLHGVADLTYVNNSPDTLREFYVQQYLNAFRPGSRWSAVDDREGRERFQHLRDPDYGYERFTATPTFDNVAIAPDYPGSPDSTVAHFRLARALAPHDTLHVHFEWDARLSTVLRRNGRAGRSYDFAQWYPKVAVYDRAGWEPNPLVPAGEFYGEFGTYDVTLVVPGDEIIGATGVPVSGDPGWASVKRWGQVYIPVNAYADVPPGPQPRTVPAGDKVVRFYARNVHHFAWSMSPDYRYEGGIYVRTVPPTHFATWDTVAINVLYRPGDDTTWGGGRVVQRTINALRWLEKTWGPYAYPSFTNLHRLEGGGTEFPMMIMDGGPEYDLILHEAGHNFTYGILANNEWRSGWMDEGLTSYQTSWALGQTPQEVARSGVVPAPPRLAEGYRVNAETMTPAQRGDFALARLDMLGHSQPIGTPAYAFRDFGTYNAMIYNRGELMYSQLRDALGDTTFAAFFHDYYNRWSLKHVDERAMEASAERVSGQRLDWFFREWVHDVGLVDYALAGATTSRTSDGKWLTRATVVRRGDYVHPMPVGVRTAAGWTIGRGNATDDVQVVQVVTPDQPLEVRLDPWHTTYDWDRRNDVAGPNPLGLGGAQAVFDWPFLDQSNRDHALVALSPMAWYSNGGAMTIGVRARTNYAGLVDRYDFGLAVGTASRTTARGLAPSGASRVQAWWRFENPYPGLASAPLIGLSGGAALLDGIARVDLSQRWDLSPLWTARGPQVSASLGATGAYPYDRAMLPEGWDDRALTELHGTFGIRVPRALLADSGYSSVDAGAGVGVAAHAPSTYGRAELTARSANYWNGGANALLLRAYGALSSATAAQAALHLSAESPLETFANDWYRPQGAILKRPGVNFLPFGGAGLRAYDPMVTVRRILAVNGEMAQRLVPMFFDRLSLWGSVFGDAGFASSTTYTLDGAFLADAGAGLAVRGKLYDRDVTLRLDVPLFAHQPALAGGRGLTKSGADVAARWVFSFSDLW